MKPPDGVLECLLLATRRHPAARNRLLLFPQLRTFRGPRWTSACDPTRTFAGTVNVSARTGNIRCPPEVRAHLLAGPVFGYLNPGNRLMPHSTHRALFPISGSSMSEPYLLTRASTSRSRQRLQLSQNTRSPLSFAMRFARVAGLRANVFP